MDSRMSGCPSGDPSLRFTTRKVQRYSFSVAALAGGTAPGEGAGGSMVGRRYSDTSGTPSSRSTKIGCTVP
jgi:hypothetical protein